MKWVAAILMILNVIIFLGVSDRQVDAPPSQFDSRPDVNRESMLLLKEVQPEEDPGARIGSPTVVTAPDFSGILEGADSDSQDLALVTSEDSGSLIADGAVLGDVSEGAVPDPTPAPQPPVANAAPSVNTPDTVGPALCYRVGPFKDAITWQEALAWASEEGIIFQPVRSESRELRAVRVYIGPFPSIGATADDVQILKDKELDYFVYLHESREARISLGYFTQEELATKFVAYLNSENISARSQPEYRTLGPFDWMDIPTESARRSIVFNRDWGDEEILVAERECES